MRIASSGLRRLIAEPVQRPAQPKTGTTQTAECELCAEVVASGHRHLIDLEARVLRCACRACALLFDRPAGGGGHYRLVPDRRWHLPDFTLDDAAWESLRIPVDMAFFFRDSAAGRVVAFYPSPAGAVESLLDLATWAGLEAANRVLGRIAPDVEALLVNRAHGARDHWLVPIDDCYALVGLIRTGWKGLGGGPAVWDGITTFYGDLRARARPLSTAGDGPLSTASGATGDTVVANTVDK